MIIMATIPLAECFSIFTLQCHRVRKHLYKASSVEPQTDEDGFTMTKHSDYNHAADSGSFDSNKTFKSSNV